MSSTLNNYQLLEVLKFLRRNELDKCELVTHRVWKVVEQNSHRLALRLCKAMTVISEFSESFPHIPLQVSEQFHKCERKCLSHWNDEQRHLIENIASSTILASIANDYDKVQLCISPRLKCNLDAAGHVVITAPNQLKNAEIVSSVLHWVSHCQGCTFESVYLRAALSAELFDRMGVTITCGDFNLITRIYINEFEQVLHFLERHVRARTISLDFLDTLELDTPNPVMAGNIVGLRKLVLNGKQQCGNSFTLSHCKLDFGFFIGIIEAFIGSDGAQVQQMIPSCKFNFNSSAISWPELEEDQLLLDALVDVKVETEIGCQHRFYIFQQETTFARVTDQHILKVTIFFIDDAISAVHLNL